MPELVGGKRWWSSKTVWSDVITAAVGVYAVIVPILASHGISLPPLDGGLLGTILSILAGLGIYGRKTATTVIGPN